VDAATCESAGLDADNPCIQYFGRWDRSNPKQPVGNWGPLAVTASFTGTSCTLNLIDEQLTATSIPGTGNYYQVSIDGGPFTVVPSSSMMTYPVASGLAAGTHTIALVRRTESKFGKTTFLGFTLDSGATLALPPAPPAHKVELFGDSISAGLANEDSGPWDNTTENGYMAFGPQVARLLEAEWRVEARGGGAFYDTWLPMVPFFDKTFGPTDNQMAPDPGAVEWDFAQWQPDVYILALGTNDWSATQPHIDESSYETFYQTFLTSLRKWYPKTEIFCLAPFQDADQMTGDPAGGAPWDEARTYIAHAVMTFGDAHVHAVIPVMGNAASGYTGEWITHPGDYVSGDYTHPNISGDTKIAAKLQSIIAPVMGW
jgi:hypothetical protein